MSIIAVAEESGRNHTQNWKAQRSYQRTWIVQSDTRYEGPLVVVNAVGIPDILDPYPTDPYALAQTKSCEQLEDQMLWRVTVAYDSVFDENPLYYVADPLSRWTKVELDTQTYQWAVQYDYDNEPIQNSAGVPYDPPEMVDLVTPIIRLIKNKSTQSLPELASLQMVVNDDAYLGFAPGQLLLRRYTVTQLQENAVLFFQHVYEIAVKWDGWKKKLLDMGFQTRDEDGDLRIIRGTDDQPFPHPSKLDGAGGLLPEEDPPVFNEFTIYRPISFSTYLPTVP